MSLEKYERGDACYPSKSDVFSSEHLKSEYDVHDSNEIAKGTYFINKFNELLDLDINV